MSVEEAMKRAEAAVQKGEWDNAIADYTDAIRLDQNRADAYRGRGSIYAVPKGNSDPDFDKALADYTEAIRLDPQNAMSYSGRGQVYADRAEFVSEDQADSMLNKAIADYSEAIKLDPKDSGGAYMRLAHAYTFKGEYDHKNHWGEVIANYSEAIRLETRPDLLASFYSMRGSAYSKNGEQDKAEQDYARAHQLNPKMFPDL